MSKSNFFVKSYNKFYKFINSLLENNLNKLNLNNLRNLTKNNKIILTFVALSVLFVCYLLIPTFFKQSQISKELKKEIFEKYNLNLNFRNNLNYNIFPRPHFTNNDTVIYLNNEEISKN